MKGHQHKQQIQKEILLLLGEVQTMKEQKWDNAVQTCFNGIAAARYVEKNVDSFFTKAENTKL